MRSFLLTPAAVVWLAALLAGLGLTARALSAQPSLAARPIAATTAQRLQGRGGLVIEVLVDSALLGGADVEVVEVTFPAGSAGGGHQHGGVEILYVLSGELEHVVGQSAVRLTRGMAGVVRLGATVSHRVVSSEPVRALVIWVPGGELGRIRPGFTDQGRRPLDRLDQDLSALSRLREQWTALYNRGDTVGLRPLYAGDAVRMPYDAGMQTGQAAIMEGFVRSFAARPFAPRLQLTADQIHLSDDRAVERGRYYELMTPRQGRRLEEIGKYVQLSRRGADGEWRIEWSIFNRDGPALAVP